MRLLNNFQYFVIISVVIYKVFLKMSDAASVISRMKWVNIYTSCLEYCTLAGWLKLRLNLLRNEGR